MLERLIKNIKRIQVIIDLLVIFFEILICEIYLFKKVVKNFEPNLKSKNIRRRRIIFTFLT